MPLQGTFVGMLAIRLALGVQIGEPIQLRKTVGMVLVHHMDLNLSKALG